MISEIRFQFPHTSQDAVDFFSFLSLLLSEDVHSQKNHTAILFSPNDPPDAFPKTSLTTADISSPQILFAGDPSFDIAVGNIYVRDLTQEKNLRFIERGIPLTKEIKSDALGNYKQITNNTETLTLLAMKDVYKRLKGNIVRLDHTGLNFPSALITKNQWEQLSHIFAKHTYVSSYPGVDSWQFIIPATKEELVTGIHEYTLGRFPKFECVYDTQILIPIIQFDIETSLSKDEVFSLFPDPYGFYYPDLFAR